MHKPPTNHDFAPTCVFEHARHVAAVARHLSQVGGQRRKAVVAVQNDKGGLPARLGGLRSSGASPACGADVAAVAASGSPQGAHKCRDAGHQRLLGEVGGGGDVDDIKLPPCGRCRRCGGSAALSKAVCWLSGHRLHFSKASL